MRKLTGKMQNLMLYCWHNKMLFMVGNYGDLRRFGIYINLFIQKISKRDNKPFKTFDMW
jgi:hypothetical protein